jgi:hypothetical protein
LKIRFERLPNDTVISFGLVLSTTIRPYLARCDSSCSR